MYVSIRQNTFETNSSSTHSLTLTKGDKIFELLQEASNRSQDIFDIDDIYKVLGLIRQAERLLLDSLGEY